MATSTISKETLARMTADDLRELAERLESDNYPTPFAGLKDWHLLRAIAIQRPELAQPYIHLLDNEAFDAS